MITLEWILAKVATAAESPVAWGVGGGAITATLQHLRTRWTDRKNASLASRKQGAEETDSAFKRLSSVVDVLQEEMTSTKTELTNLRDELRRERARAEEADAALARARRELRQATHDLRNAHAHNAALKGRLQTLTALLQQLTAANPSLATASVDATLQATIQLTPVVHSLAAPEGEVPAAVADEPFMEAPRGS